MATKTPNKKHIYATEEDPVYYTKFGVKGVIQVKEIDTLGNDHFFYFDPDTFAKLKKDRHGNPVNPLTQRGIPDTNIVLLSPPSSKKRDYSAAAKVIQRRTRAYLKKKQENIDPITVPSNYGMNEKQTITYQGHVLKVPVSADWKPIRVPKEYNIPGFDWKKWRAMKGNDDINEYIGFLIGSHIQKNTLQVVPGDILHIEAMGFLNFYYYITRSGSVKELPLDRESETILFIPKEAMAPFYKHRKSSPELYRGAVYFYTQYLIEHGTSHSDEETSIMLHQYHRNTETIDYYDYALGFPVNKVVIKRNMPIPDKIEEYLNENAGTPSPNEIGGGRRGRQGRKTGKKKSNI